MHEARSGPGRAGYRPALDGIRAVAVVLVILFHLGAPWLPGGFIGVDVFFVLSGYLITGLLLDELSGSGSIRLRRFYARRIRRLLPASVAVLAVVTVLSVHLFDAVLRQEFGQDTTAAALYSANWRFALSHGDYFAPGDVPSPVVHYWSLAVEEQFYLLWPGVILGLWWLVRRVLRRSSELALLVPIGLLIAASAIASIVLVPSPLAYYGTHTRAYQLLAGAALAIVVRRWSFVRLRRPFALGAVVAVGALVWTAHAVPNASGYPGWPAVWVTLASLLLIVGVDVATAGPVRSALGHPAPALVGRLSYSLYIWHWPVIVFLPLLAARWDADSLGGTPAAVAATLLLAFVSYLVVERPIRFHLRPSAPAGAVVAVGLAMSVIVGVSGIPWLQPRDAFASQALSTVRDLAKPGRCPYFAEDWGSPRTSEPCLWRDGRGPTVALVGDSHAQQWQPALDVLGARYDLRIIRATRGGCPANDITVYATVDTGRVETDEACSEWRHRVYPEIVSRYRPDVVFIATRSQVRGLVVDGVRVPPEDPDHLQDWRAGWDWTLRTLGSAGARVIVSRILPSLPQRIPACLINHGDGTQRCDFPADGDVRTKPYNAAIDALAEDHPGVRVVDPTTIGCPGGECRAMAGDIIVHRDDNHLSATFVRSRATEFERLLRSAGVTW